MPRSTESNMRAISFCFSFAYSLLLSLALNLSASRKKRLACSSVSWKLWDPPSGPCTESSLAVRSTEALQYTTCSHDPYSARMLSMTWNNSRRKAVDTQNYFDLGYSQMYEAVADSIGLSRIHRYPSPTRLGGLAGS